MMMRRCWRLILRADFTATRTLLARAGSNRCVLIWAAEISLSLACLALTNLELLNASVFSIFGAQVFKSFDTNIGIDVAWSKINADSNHLSEQQLQAVVLDIQKGLDLEHPNIIKCFKCWENFDNHCINLITELFTSGNLRQYRNLHKHLDLKAVKRMARQILKGLSYLHSMDPPVVHGDLRCDKIYVNGHSGEIKIGDLGLATLMPYRWEGAGPQPEQPVMDQAADVFAFGLCMLELLTLKQLDPQHCSQWEQLLADLLDDEARQFVAKCLADTRPSAQQLIEDPFLTVKKAAPAVDGGQGGGQGNVSSGGQGGSNGGSRFDHSASSSKSLHGVMAHEKRKTEEGSEDPSGAPIAVGKLRGEDYNFEFAGKVCASISGM